MNPGCLLRSLWLLATTATLPAQNASVVLEYGRGLFEYRTQVAGRVTFAEAPTISVVSSSPGGHPQFIYYDRLTYAPVGAGSTARAVSFSTVSRNSNKPGQSRLSDIRHRGTFDFYNVGSGNLLRPGLGNIRNDDGVLIDLPPGANAIGMNFGSIQQTSPCCVIQRFRFFLTNGQTTDITWSGGNYQGRQTELSHSTFVGFHAFGANIRALEINQLGHNPILDNVIFGRTDATRAPTGQPPIMIQTTALPRPTGGEVSSRRLVRVEITDPLTGEVRNLDELREIWCASLELFESLAPVVNAAASVPWGSVAPGPVVGDYASLLDRFVRPDVQIRRKFCNAGQRRSDYGVIAEHQLRELPLQFVEEFGSAFAGVEELFQSWLYAQDHAELALITLERLIGAVIDGNAAAAQTQSATLTHLLSEHHYAQLRAATAFGEVRAIVEQLEAALLGGEPPIVPGLTTGALTALHDRVRDLLRRNTLLASVL